MYKSKILKNPHCFFSRNGGVSKNDFNSLNISYDKGDDKENVFKNREIIKKIFKAEKFILPNQTHSSIVLFVDDLDKEYNCDALICEKENILIGVKTADCVPILIENRKTKVVAAIHAGWKGALSNIIENTLDELPVSGCVASVGPCISQKYFKIGEEVKELINDKRFLNGDFFDLKGYVIDKLQKNGVEIVDDLNLDTYSGNFFSRRKSLHENKKFGTQASTIMLGS